MQGFAANPSFTRFWLGETATVLAYQFLIVAIGWQVYDITGSALDLGLVGLAHFFAQVLFSLSAGHVADRHDRKLIAAVCQWVKAIVAVTLAIGSVQGWIGAAAIYAAAFLVGAATTFQSPALRAMLPSLVGEDRFPSAIAWTAAARKAAIIIGPALGGLLYVAGPAVVYAISAAIFIAAGLLIHAIRSLRPSRAHEPVTLRYVLGGIHYIRTRPVILGAVTLDLFATLLGGAVALMPIYARDILDTGPWGLGILRAAPAVGALFASAYLLHHPLTRNVGRIMFASVAIFGLGTIVFGLSTSLVLSLVALVVLGAGDMVSVVIRTTLIQLETPDEMRGRVSAVNSLCTGTSNQLGQFESGLTAAWWGAVPSVVVGGIGTIVVAGLWIRLFPSLLARQTLGPLERD
jgi:MFS family permease